MFKSEIEIQQLLEQACFSVASPEVVVGEGTLSRDKMSYTVHSTYYRNKEKKNDGGEEECTIILAANSSSLHRR